MAASSNDRTGWRIPKEQEDDDRLIVAQKKKKSNKAKVTVPHVPLQRYNSAIMVVATTARSSPIAVEAKGRCGHFLTISVCTVGARAGGGN